MPEIADNPQELLAMRVIALAKAEIIAENHFLSALLGRLVLEPAYLRAPFATDGFSLAFDTDQILQAYCTRRAAPVHDLLHSVIHCVFLHPYVGASVDRSLWSLASDIAAERAVAELAGARPGDRGAQIASVLGFIDRDLGVRAGAEKIYHQLKAGRWEDKREEWAALFASDAHDLWYLPLGANDGDNDKSARDRDDDPSKDAQDKPDQRSQQTRAQGKENKEADSGSRRRGGVVCPPIEEQKEDWRRAAASLAINLQTSLSREASAYSGLVEELQASVHKRMDYRDFLHSFAAYGEHMRLSDEDFDTTFYTYGMKLYGDMPLIEPLEMREEKRIRDFVLVLDTSGSVFGDVVKRFVEVSFDILTSSEAFFERVCVHIIQCDTEVRSDTIITSAADLETWKDGFTVRGKGGTDFRPAFEYVEELQKKGAFGHLNGLVYFTDGWGTYPEWVPSYRVAFVFFDEDFRPEQVPPWAMQLVLDGDTIREWETGDADGYIASA